MPTKSQLKPTLADLEAVRTKITTVADNIAALDKSPLVLAEAAKRIKQRITQAKEHYCARLETGAFTYSESKTSDFALPPVDLHDALTGLAATFFPDALERILLEQVKAVLERSSPLSAAERTTQRGQLLLDRDRLEEQEERIIRALEESGLPVHRRREAPLTVVLNLDHPERPTKYNRRIFDRLCDLSAANQGRLAVLVDRRAKPIDKRRERRQERLDLDHAWMHKRLSEEDYHARVKVLEDEIQELTMQISEVDDEIARVQPEYDVSTSLATEAQKIVEGIEERKALSCRPMSSMPAGAAKPGRSIASPWVEQGTLHQGA